jgi:hypothetical protein
MKNPIGLAAAALLALGCGGTSSSGSTGGTVAGSNGSSVAASSSSVGSGSTGQATDTGSSGTPGSGSGTNGSGGTGGSDASSSSAGSTSGSTGHTGGTTGVSGSITIGSSGGDSGSSGGDSGSSGGSGSSGAVLPTQCQPPAALGTPPTDPPPANDHCADAEVIDPATQLGVPIDGTTLNAANDFAFADSRAACTVPLGNTGADVFYRFTPAVSGKYLFTVVALVRPGNGTWDPTITVYDQPCPASCADTPDCLAGGNMPGLGRDDEAVADLSAGHTYLVAVDGDTALTDDEGPFTLTVSTISTPPNDTCSAPKVLPEAGGLVGDGVHGAEAFLAAEDQYNPGAAAAGCTGAEEAGPELVYSFTPASTGLYTFTATRRQGLTGVDLYVLDACPAAGTAPAACLGGALSDGVTAVDNVQLTAGQTYYLVAEAHQASDPLNTRLNLSFDTTFDLTAALAVPGPQGDRCENPKKLLEGGGALSGETWAGYAGDYNPGAAGCTHANEPGPDVVYRFTPHNTGTYLFTVSPAQNNAALYVYDSCPAVGVGACLGGVDTAYAGSPEQLSIDLTAGQDCFLVVDSPGTGTSGDYDLSVEYLVQPVPGDTCAAAVPIDPDTQLGLVLSNSTSGAANDLSFGNWNDACTGAITRAHDVVYSFTPVADGTYDLTATPLGWDLALYVTSSCDASTAVGQCLGGTDVPGNGAETLSLPMTAGVTYFIVVDGLDSGPGYNGQFTLTLAPH